MKTLHKMAAGLLLSIVLAAGLQGTLELTLQTQAQESTQRAVKETADLKFLSYCDESKLTGITVTAEQAAEMQELIDELIQGAATDYQKAQNIYNWIYKNIKYEGNESVTISAQPYDVYTSRRGVCGGFSNLCNELFHLAGIPSVAVTGYYYNLAHQWNVVYADGKWFYVDATDSSGASFDQEHIWNTHKVVEVYNASIETEGILLSYYNGIAVVGTKEPMKTLIVPDEYQGMKVTSISYQVYDKEYGVEILNLNANIDYMEIGDLKAAQLLKEVNVSEDNKLYASRDGVLYTKDMKTLLAYPKGRTETKFLLPKETTDMNMKDAFENGYLSEIEVEEGNTAYASYDGALYNASKTELLFVPGGKTIVKVPENATINDMAFVAFYDKEVITIYGTPGSYAETFAGWYNMTFIDIAEWEEPSEEEEVVRLAGEGRYDTAYAAANQLKEALGGKKFEAVVVATGRKFADALAGSYLAVQKNAPILLTNGQSDNVQRLHEYIKQNVILGATIYILGEKEVVPKRVEDIEGYKVKRLGGATRYDTNLEILKEAGVKESIIVATGKTAADSLSASAVNIPILLVKPDASLNEEQKEILKDVKNIYIVGGTSAVNEKYEEELKNHGEVVRIEGSDRYETSVNVAKKFFENVDTVVVASGRDKNFSDGLCGGPLAAALEAPLVLTKDNGTYWAKAYVAEEALTGGYVLGGDSALSNEAVVDVFELESAEEIK